MDGITLSEIPGLPLCGSSLALVRSVSCGPALLGFGRTAPVAGVSYVNWSDMSDLVLCPVSALLDGSVPSRCWMDALVLVGCSNSMECQQGLADVNAGAVPW